MYRQLIRHSKWLGPVALALIASLSAPPAIGQAKPITPLRAGDRFPAGEYKVFNPQGDVLSVDLGESLGKKAIVLYYWIPGNPRAEKVFSELLAVTRELDPAKLAVFGVAVSNPSIGVTPDIIRERIAAVGVDVPVLNDEGFPIGKRLMIRSVPHITIIDRKGRLRLSNGASLGQDLEYKVDIAAAVRRAAASDELHTYGFLPPYYPVHELAGRPAPEFKAPLVTNGQARSWSDLLNAEKVNVLVFWSVDCPHCREQLPEINSWIRENPERTSLVGFATVNDEKDATRTREFCEANGLVFPNLLDQNAEISQIYGVTTTPTVVIVRPDGVVDSAITSSVADFGSTMERKQKRLLK